MNLLKDDIPEFLKCSPYLHSLIANGDFPADGVEVPTDCFKADTQVLDVSDLDCLLKTLRYWLLPELLSELEEVHIFVLDPKNKPDVIQILNNFKTELPHVDKLLPLVAGNSEGKLCFAAGRGFHTLLDSLCRSAEVLEISNETIDWQRVLISAAIEGKLSCLQFLHENGQPFSTSVPHAAAENGRLDCLEYVFNTLEAEDRVMRTDEFFEAAAKGGHIHILRYLQEKFGVPEDDDPQQAIWCHAARAGHCDVMRFLGENNFDFEATDVFAAAVEGGHIPALQYLINKLGVPDEDDALSMWNQAAEANHLDVMKFLHEHVLPRSFEENDPDFDPYDSLLYVALGADCIPCIDYLRELGHPWDEVYTEYAADNGFVELFHYLLDQGCPCNSEKCSSLFAQAGSLDGLKFIFERGLPWGADSCEAAVENDHVDCLVFLVQNGCPGNYDQICVSAAANLSCLTYAHQQGGKLSTEAAVKAAQAGALDSLQYLHAQGCVFTVEVANAYVQHNLPTTCLQFLLDVGCPVNEETCKLAATRFPFGSLAGSSDEKLACLKLLHERDCPWDERTCMEAASCVNITCLQYAVEHGCPWGEETRAVAKLHCAKYLENWTLKRKSPPDQEYAPVEFAFE